MGRKAPAMTGGEAGPGVLQRVLRRSFLLRIALLPMAVVGLFALLFLVSNAALHTQQEAMKAVVETDLETSARLAQINSRLQKANTDVYRLITDAATGGGKELTPRIQDLAKRVEAIIVDLQEYRNSEAAAPQRETLDTFIDNLGVYNDAIGWIGSMLEIDFQTSIAFIAPYNTQVDGLSQQLSAIIADSTTKAKLRADKATEALRRVAYYFAAAAASVSILVAMFGYLSGKRQEFLYRAAREKDREVHILLDNSGQGFMSFGADMVVGAGVSRACEEMFGGNPAGRRACLLLFPGDEAARSLMRTVVAKAAAEPNALRRSMLLSLLPTEVSVRGKTLAVEYRPLDTGRIMLVATDVSEARALALQVEQQRQRQEMIVAVITEGADVRSAIADFRHFIRDETAAAKGAAAVGTELIERIFREVHTFKGTFGQFSFRHLPDALHRLETTLQAQREAATPPSAAQVRAILAEADCLAHLEADLAGLRQALGADVVDGEGVITLSAAAFRQLEDLARTAAARDPEARPLLHHLTTLRQTPLKTALADFDRLIQRVAERCEKEVAPLEINGDDVFVEPDSHMSFLRSLGHVFRNAVDHGIESPDVRLAAGKDEAGHIRVTITAGRDGSIAIAIADDGAGLDVEALRLRTASVAGEAGQPQLSDAELLDQIFTDGISTRAEVTDLSGRGVGLAAVRAAVHDLGGSVQVSSQPGQGTLFHFNLPGRTRSASEAA
jgi:signal transduction histidine kinase